MSKSIKETTPGSQSPALIDRNQALMAMASQVISLRINMNLGFIFPVRLRALITKLLITGHWAGCVTKHTKAELICRLTVISSTR